jgi:hypothetical protein
VVQVSRLVTESKMYMTDGRGMAEGTMTNVEADMTADVTSNALSQVQQHHHDVLKVAPPNDKVQMSPQLQEAQENKGIGR